MEFVLSLGKGFTSENSFWMFSILIVQVVAVSIIIERVYALFVSRKPDQKEASKILLTEIQTGTLDSALALAKKMKSTHKIASVAEAGIISAMNQGSKEEIQSKMDEVLLKAQATIEKRIGLLALTANLATLLGLLGTITGLIQSFSGINNTNPAEKSEILSNGISLAMNATAYGLLVAVPALIMYAILNNRASRLTYDLNKGALSVFIQLGFHYEPKPRQKR